MEQNEILSRIKDGVQEVIPDAKVYLFGSRARGDWHEESDWDILVLTDSRVDRNVRDEVHKAIYPISFEINDFINYVVLNHDDWETAPSYYSLHKTATLEMISL